MQTDQGQREPIDPGQNPDKNGLGVVRWHSIDGILNLCKISSSRLINSHDNSGGTILRPCRRGSHGTRSPQGQGEKDDMTKMSHFSQEDIPLQLKYL